MATVDIKSNIRRLFNVINSGELSSVDEFIKPNFHYRSTAGEQVHGLDGFKDFISQYREAFSDFEISIEEIFVEGHKTVTMYRQMGTQTGKFMGIDPTNEEMNVLICSIATYDDDGKIIGVLEVFDSLDLFRQLGAVPKEVEEWAESVTGSPPAA